MKKLFQFAFWGGRSEYIVADDFQSAYELATLTFPSTQTETGIDELSTVTILSTNVYYAYKNPVEEVESKNG